MKIVIYGLSQPGVTIATFFSELGHDVIVIDEDAAGIADLSSKIDAQCFCGNAASINDLNKLDLTNVDLFIASSYKDENNLLAAHFAKTIYQVRFSLCYLMQQVFASRNRQTTLQKSQLAIDKIISPEKAIAQHVVHNIVHDAFINIYPLSNLGIYFCVFEFQAENDFIGLSLKEWLQSQQVKITPLIIKKEGIYDAVNLDDVINVGDLLFFCADEQDVEAFNAQNTETLDPQSNIVVLGGGRFGGELAKRLAGSGNVKNLKVIEKDLDKAKILSQSLEQAVVLNGNALDPVLLEEAGVGKETQVLCCMDQDESNILSALLARKMSAESMVLIHSATYFDILLSLGIKHLVRIREIIVSEMLSCIPFRAVKILRVFGGYEWFLCSVHLYSGSSLIGKTDTFFKKKGITKVAGIVRKDSWIPLVEAQDHTFIEDDKIIVVIHKTMVKELDKIF
ncbi:MAG: hypothetical protein CMM87_05140 [Rickettsiales bacterium]|nr:hypothetical protein [Rickettsiales bacterium]|tara:strand:- start:38681 stop:40036 length:1356 start_codon:yes stop_codon:yes gene_type:complete